MKQILLALLLPWFVLPLVQGQSPLYQPVPFSKVEINDAFWRPRLEKTAATTLPVCIAYTEQKTGRIRNFEKAARGKGEPHEGIYYDDSDVYKALEAIAYALKTRRDTALERTADDWIAKIVAAQQPDGYINTYYTLTGLDKRWTDMAMHEDYCAGHLIEAGVAYFEATGKRALLDVGIRMADHIDRTFGPGKRHWVTGHQELELALVKLYTLTKERRYLDLAHWLIEERGHGHGKGYIWDDWKDPGYCQDKTPLRETTDITGHAVRAMYLYTGAADVAAHTGDSAYLRAMLRVWEDVVHRNLYVTGGIGALGRNEGFGADYDLPNEQAYCETCASVGMVFWNQRMHQLTGEARFYDVLERSLYNGALDGVSLDGDLFFYTNPLASKGQHKRREWYGTACCPSNIARLLASLGSYIYGAGKNDLWVNLYIGSETKNTIGGQPVAVKMETIYPWEGNVRLTLEPGKPQNFALHLRIPGWARGEASPGGLYRFLNPPALGFTLKINGQTADYRWENGYIVIDRRWQKGDVVDLALAMPVQRVLALDSVPDNRTRTALQRGPLMYCFEDADNNGSAFHFTLPDRAAITADWHPKLLGGITVLQATVPAVQPAEDGRSVQTVQQTVTAIPYFAWNNRGPGEMQVWVPRKIGKVRVE